MSPANEIALAQVEAWPSWPGGRLAVAGPEGSGKTHLAHVWAALSRATILPVAAVGDIDLTTLSGASALALEDVDGIAALPDTAAAEEALFHVMNHLASGGGSLMVTGRDAPARWRIALPDLASRLEAAPVARVEAPDDSLLAAVLVKLFADRQIAVGPDLIRYLVTRIDRSLAAARQVVETLDRVGLARQRPITLRLAAEVLSTDE